MTQKFIILHLIEFEIDDIEILFIDPSTEKKLKETVL